MQEKTLTEYLGKYRLVLMGLATLEVMLHHQSSEITWVLWPYIKGFFVTAVDTFVLISGLSMARSYKENCKGDWKKFYKKRILRLLPEFLVFIVIAQFCLLRWSYPIEGQLAAEMHSMSFWISIFSYRWYVPCIILFYLLTPIIDYCFNVARNKKLCLVVLWVGAVLFSFVSLGKSTFMIILTRLPDYILGYYIGSEGISFKASPKKWVGIWAIATVALLSQSLCIANFTGEYMSDMGLWWYPLIFMVLPLSIIRCGLFDKIGAPKFFELLGKYSLEIYLWHEFILVVIGRSFGRGYKGIPLNLAAIIVTIPWAIAYHKVFELIIKVVRKK